MKRGHCKKCKSKEISSKIKSSDDLRGERENNVNFSAMGIENGVKKYVIIAVSINVNLNWGTAVLRPKTNRQRQLFFLLLINQPKVT